MAETLLAVVQRNAQKVGLDPTFTSFSNDDETSDIVVFTNDALLELLDALPNNTPYLANIDGDFSTVNGTRLYALETATRSFNLLEWSVENETDSDAPMQVVTPDYLKGIDAKWNETTGVPRYLYLEGSDQVGAYPVPDGVYNIKYRYKSGFTALTLTTDVFPVPDAWIRQFIDKKVEALYKKGKGFREAEDLMLEADRDLISILGTAYAMNPTYVTPDGND
jgi:hypothetical protein